MIDYLGNYDILEKYQGSFFIVNALNILEIETFFEIDAVAWIFCVKNVIAFQYLRHWTNWGVVNISVSAIYDLVFQNFMSIH